jgi:hypothetical protein
MPQETNHNSTHTHDIHTQKTICQKTINQKKITDNDFKKALQENLLKRKKATKNRNDGV